MQVLITSPETDKLTRYLRTWSKNFIKKHKNQHSFLHLEKARATSKQVYKALTKKPLDIVLFNGHGSHKHILGDKNENIIDITKADLLKDKIIHALSCSTAKELGPTAIRHGAKGYIGYYEDFVIAFDRNKPLSDPSKDQTASLFLDAAFTAPKALLDGKSPEEAVKLTIDAYNRSITKALMSSVQSDDDQFVGLLLWDRDNIIACR